MEMFAAEKRKATKEDDNNGMLMFAASAVKDIVHFSLQHSLTTNAVRRES